MYDHIEVVTKIGVKVPTLLKISSASRSSLTQSRRVWSSSKSKSASFSTGVNPDGVSSAVEITGSSSGAVLDSAAGGDSDAVTISVEVFSSISISSRVQQFSCYFLVFHIFLTVRMF